MKDRTKPDRNLAASLLRLPIFTLITSSLILFQVLVADEQAVSLRIVALRRHRYRFRLNRLRLHQPRQPFHHLAISRLEELQQLEVLQVTVTMDTSCRSSLNIRIISRFH